MKMVSSGKGLILAFVFFLALSAASKAADTPPAKPAALASLETMVGNLGYTTTDTADKRSFSITWTGRYNYIIHFDLSKDGTLAYAYVHLTTFTPAQLAKLKFVKLLRANDVSDFYFSMESFDSGEILYVNAIIPMAGLTPQNLRSTLDGWTGKI